ncbi:MAG TPA: hypothetical protein VD908_15895 [Cytophagales bacterium]|nr:hypothetical protein [Cytophagales bacterium]
MEKISLLLLFAKKTLIGTAIAGILGLGGGVSFFDNVANEEQKSDTIEKRGSLNPTRTMEPRKH